MRLTPNGHTSPWTPDPDSLKHPPTPVRDRAKRVGLLTTIQPNEVAALHTAAKAPQSVTEQRATA